MKKRQQIPRAVTAILAISFAVGLTAREARAQSCCKDGGKGGTGGASCHDSGASQPGNAGYQSAYRDLPIRDDRSFHAPHGGQLSKTTWNYFEVVYGPQETRLYTYDMFRGPISTRGVQGQVTMQVRSNGGQYRYPLQYVPVAAGQDYLAVRVDMTRVRDGDMDVYFDLANLPNRESPTARFSQAFSMSRPSVQPIPVDTRRRSPQIVVTTATSADDPAIRAQGMCPVMNKPLGNHGKPVKIVIDGQPLFVCCKGCVSKVKKNPDMYLAKVAQLGRRG